MTDPALTTDAGETGSGGHDSILTVDLDALAENHRRLQARLAHGRAAAVVKADGYGLGAEPVVRRLRRDGVTTYFVAHIDEAFALRAAFPDIEIFVLNGLIGDDIDDLANALAAAQITPVLNDPGQIARWSQAAASLGGLPAAIHVDTGMTRLGLTSGEFDGLLDDPGLLRPFSSVLLMSHLACADEPDHPLNQRQAELFAAAVTALAPDRASLANSSGIFLGDLFQHDLARPGIALYGGNPTPGKPNPMLPVVTLAGRILQLREIDAPLSVGYGATHTVTPPAWVATVAIGYADGFTRHLSNAGHGFVAGIKVPLIGRVSMDLLTFDVTGVPQEACRPGRMIEVLNGEQTVDDLAALANTIGYEILTSLGPRYTRIYTGAA